MKQKFELQKKTKIPPFFKPCSLFLCLVLCVENQNFFSFYPCYTQPHETSGNLLRHQLHLRKRSQDMRKANLKSAAALFPTYCKKSQHRL